MSFDFCTCKSGFGDTVSCTGKSCDVLHVFSVILTVKVVFEEAVTVGSASFGFDTKVAGDHSYNTLLPLLPLSEIMLPSQPRTSAGATRDCGSLIETTTVAVSLQRPSLAINRKVVVVCIDPVGLTLVLSFNKVPGLHV